MRNNNMNTSFPKFFGEAIDTLFNTNLSDIIGADFSMNSPKINVIENDNDFEIELAAPGLNKKDFNIEIDNDQLKISVEHNSDTEGEDIKDAKSNYRRREFDYSSFTRSFNLPESVDRAHIEATYTNGILLVKLNKKEEAKEKGPQTIKIS